MRSCRCVFTVAFLLLVVAPTFSQTCIDYSQCGAGVFGQADTLLRTEEIVIDNDYAYVAGGTEGLMVYSLADPQQPALAATIQFFDFVDEIVVANGYAYLVGDYDGGVICDVTSPENPVLMGSWASTATITDMAVSGSCLYLAEPFSAGIPDSYILRCLDVSDPTNPVAIAVVDTFEAGWFGGAQLKTHGGHLYFATPRGTRIYDITAPFSPLLLSETQGGYRGISIVGQTAYLAQFRSLVIVDISVPTAPVEQSSLDFSHATNFASLCVQDGIVYLGTEEFSIEVVDATDPLAPLLKDTVYLSASIVSSVVANGYIYAANRLDGFYVVSPGDGTECFGAGDTSLPGDAFDLVVSGEYAHIASGAQLVTCDVSDPAAPVVVASLPVTGSAQGIAATATELYVATAVGGGLRVASGAGTAAPQWIGFLAYPHALKVAVQEDICWVMDRERGLCAVDISDPTQPIEISAHALKVRPYSLAVDGDRAVVGYSRNDPQVFDISNPAAPVVLGDLPGVLVALSITMHGSLVYVPDYWLGLKIYDIQAPAPYVMLSNLQLPEFDLTDVVEVSATKAYLGQSTGSLYILDVTNPAAPRVIERLETVGDPNAIVIGPDHVYVTTLTEQLHILPANCDASSLPTPVLGGLVQGEQRVLHWNVPQDPLYVETCLYRGTAPGFVLDTPIACVANGFYLESYNGSAYYVVRHRDVHGQYTFDSNEVAFASAAEVPAADPAWTLMVAPNPFNPATIVTFTTDRQLELSLEVFDLRGRRVEKLFQGEVPEGARRVAWRGRDTLGRVLPSGTYFIRATAGTRVQTRRVTLLK